MGHKLNRDDVPIAEKVLLNYADLRRHYGWSKSKVWRKRRVELNPFPEPARDTRGSGKADWRKSDVENWLCGGGRAVVDSISDATSVDLSATVAATRGNLDIAAIAASNNLRPINWRAVLSGRADVEEISNYQRYKALAVALLTGAAIAMLDAAVRRNKS